TNLPVNRVYEIDELASALTSPTSAAVPPKPFFEDVSQLIHHSHHEEFFDDFARQPMLPKRLSQLGPGLCWCDLNGDGWDDLVIGSGKGGPLSVFLNYGKGGFKPRSGNWVAGDPTRGQTSVVAYPQSSGGLSLLVGKASYEDGLAEAACVQEYNP